MVIDERKRFIDIIKHNSGENRTARSVLIDLIQSDSRKWALCILYFLRSYHYPARSFQHPGESNLRQPLHTFKENGAKHHLEGNEFHMQNSV